MISYRNSSNLCQVRHDNDSAARSVSQQFGMGDNSVACQAGTGSLVPMK